MRRRHSLIPSYLAVIALSGCAVQSNPEVDLAAEEQAIRQVSAEWLQAASARDAAAAGAMYAPNGVSYPANHAPVVGPAAVQAYVAEQNAKYPNSSVTWTTDLVKVADSGEMAYEVGTWRWTSDPAKAEMEDTGTYVTVWIKVDGAWKAAADIGASTQPQPEPQPTS
ncbi:MAG TPA: nuclear transport factor 2 family protein [Longimicrobiales bacterium]|nr:nuclear transport factor 2 family protein [Longimicrobiales bacterium]